MNYDLPIIFCLNDLIFCNDDCEKRVVVFKLRSSLSGCIVTAVR